MQEKFCESCGMPMGETDEMYGTEADGSKSADYCSQCYGNGAFNQPNITLDEMITMVAGIMVKNFGFEPNDAMEQCNEGLPKLKRWKMA